MSGVVKDVVNMHTKPDGQEDDEPVRISFTMKVPEEVPFEVQSSQPLVPSLALNTIRLPQQVMSEGADDDEPARISFTMRVPLEVPSDLQSSMPLLVNAVK